MTTYRHPWAIVRTHQGAVMLVRVLSHHRSFLAASERAADLDIAPATRDERLWSGTDREQIKEEAVRPPRDQRPLKEFCYRGHPYSGANLKRHDGKRFCRACQAIWHKENRRIKAARLSINEDDAVRTPHPNAR